MAKEYTGQNDQYEQEICVGDLVVLGIPRKERRDYLIIFEVKKSRDGYELIYSRKFSNNTLSDTDERYRQLLQYQVSKVIGNIETGIDESMLE